MIDMLCRSTNAYVANLSTSNVREKRRRDQTVMVGSHNDINKELTDHQSGGWFLRLRKTSDVVEAPFRRICKHAGYVGDHSSDVVVSGAQMHGVHMQFQHTIAQTSVGFNVSPLPPCATHGYAVSTNLNVLR
jgi:hypothetical protein